MLNETDLMSEETLKTSPSWQEIYERSMTGFAYSLKSGANQFGTYKGFQRAKYPTLKAQVEAAPPMLASMFFPAWYLYAVAGYPFGDNKRGLKKFKRKYYEKMLTWIIRDKVWQIHFTFNV